MELLSVGNDVYLLTASIINFVGVIVNFVFLYKMHKIQIDREVLEDLIDKNKAKDELLKDYKAQIEQLKIHEQVASMRHTELQKYKQEQILTSCDTGQ